MSSQVPESNESPGNNQPPKPEDKKEAEELPIPETLRNSLLLHIEHNKFSNTIQFKNTKLLELVKAERMVFSGMTEIHRKSMNKLLDSIKRGTSYTDQDWRLSRTNHNQLNALAIRYDASPDMLEASGEALLLERVASELVQHVAEDRGSGNVHYIRAKSSKVV